MRNPIDPDLSSVRYLLTDVDDTLTTKGQLLPETFAALYRLRRGWDDEAQMREVQRDIRDLIEARLFPLFPDLCLAKDQPYRLADVAIDIGQDRAPVAPERVQQALELLSQWGVNARASSIHINAWKGALTSFQWRFACSSRSLA